MFSHEKALQALANGVDDGGFSDGFGRWGSQCERVRTHAAPSVPACGSHDAAPLALWSSAPSPSPLIPTPHRHPQHTLLCLLCPSVAGCVNPAGLWCDCILSRIFCLLEAGWVDQVLAHEHVANYLSIPDPDGESTDVPGPPLNCSSMPHTERVPLPVCCFCSALPGDTAHSDP